MSDGDKRKQDGEREDANLTPQERDFKKMHPNTWKQMQEERERNRGDRR